MSQLFSDFEDYSKNNGWGVSEHVHTISEGAVKHSDKAITISTWQSIFKQPASFFAKYDVVVGDECHLTTAKSLSSIMEKCTNAYIRAGVSGTLDGSVVNEMVLKGHYGPIYRVATTAQLMDKGILTNLAIKAIVLKHPDEACKTFWTVKCRLHGCLIYIDDDYDFDKLICEKDCIVKKEGICLFLLVGVVWYKSLMLCVSWLGMW